MTGAMSSCECVSPLSLAGGPLPPRWPLWLLPQPSGLALPSVNFSLCVTHIKSPLCPAPTPSSGLFGDYPQSLGTSATLPLGCPPTVSETTQGACGIGVPFLVLVSLVVVLDGDNLK